RLGENFRREVPPINQQFRAVAPEAAAVAKNQSLFLPAINRGRQRRRSLRLVVRESARPNQPVPPRNNARADQNRACPSLASNRGSARANCGRYDDHDWPSRAPICPDVLFAIDLPHSDASNTP